jgi:aryl-alcohol dehydrogenase-like predicted oxidoreductase
MKKKIIIGTANFVKGYGINNSKGLNLEQINNLNKFTSKNFIKEIDTAFSYKGVEKLIGKSKFKNYKIYTKIPEIKLSQFHKKFVSRIVNKSLQRLGKRKLYGVFFHGAKNLMSIKGDKFYKDLLIFKKRRIIKKIGVSVYSPTELKSVIKKYKFDMVQIPINIFDRRFLKKNFLKKIKDKSIEIHARSVFMQGILLQNNNNRNNFFKNWKKLFLKWDNWNNNCQSKKVETCLNFFKNLKYVDKLVVGVSSIQEMQEIINVLKNNKKSFPRKIFSCSKKLLEPRLWIKN